MQRARVALKLAKIPLSENKNWYVVGKANRVNVRIKCVADDNSTRLVNANVTRILADVEVEGFASDVQNLNRLRNCIREFMLTGKSTCWQTGGGGTAPGKFMPIAWTKTPKTLKLWGGNGQRYIFYCPPNGQIRPVWGSVTYTHDSSICTAAVHASQLVRSRGGNVMIELDSGPAFFQGVKRAGITSREYRGRIRAFNFMNAPTNVNAALVTIYGKSWNESESGWSGVWTRVGYTNIFSAVWKLGNQTVKALLTVQINGNQVFIDRRDSSGGVSCTYSGTLSPNRRNVSGTYTCRNSQGIFSSNKSWQATINR